MKRLAVLVLTAGVVMAAAPVRAGDPAPPRLAVPKVLAPTSPQVPVPYPDRSQLAAGPVRTAAYEVPPAEAPRPFSLAGMFRRPPAEQAAPLASYPAEVPSWAGPPTAVRQPLPPPPDVYELNGNGLATGGSCGSGSCDRGGHADRSCWSRFAGWLCYRQTPTKLPLIPTQRPAPQYTYGTGRDGPGVGRAGCGPTGCAAPVGHAKATPVAPPAKAEPAQVVAEVRMPGYRLANPERTGYSTPAPDEPGATYYRPAKLTTGEVPPKPVQRPFIQN